MKLNFRSFSHVRGPVTLSEENRSFEIVIASENPVKMFDTATGRVVPEVLLCTGCQSENGQVPLLDTHDRSSTESVLGSVTDIYVDVDQVVGTATFGSGEAALEAFKKYREGHLTDFSAGYIISDVTRVRAGEHAEIAGRGWQGPVNVVTEWILKETSCCPIGADAKAKARSYSADVIGDSIEALAEEPDGSREYVLELRERVLRGTGGDLLSEDDRRWADEKREGTETDEPPYIRRGGYTWR